MFFVLLEKRDLHYFSVWMCVNCDEFKEMTKDLLHQNADPNWSDKVVL